MDIINIGIVGLGRVANRFANAINSAENMRLHSVCSTNQDNIKRFITEYSNSSTIIGYIDYSQFLLDKLLDIVVITTPDYLHYDFIIQAAQANKHILVEKPLCTEIKDAEDIILKSKTYPVKIAIGYHLRWHKGLRALKEVLNHENIGKIFHMDLSWSHKFIEDAKWRKDNHLTKWWCLSALGTHSIDIVVWYLRKLCGEIVEIKVLTSNGVFNTNDENVIISIRFASGSTACIRNSILYNSPLSFNIYAESGIIKGYDLVGDMSNRKIMYNNNIIDFTCDNNLYQDELLDLIRAINNNSCPEVSIHDGYKNMCYMSGIIPA